MNIGDRVVSRQTGLPGVGTVCGVVTGEFVRASGPKPRWDILYPDWIEKYVYYIKYDEMRYIVSFDEYKDGSPDSIPHNDLKVMYKYSHKTNIISYPQDDLEIFEHETSSVSSD